MTRLGLVWRWLVLWLLIPVENLIPVCVKVFQVSLADTIYTIMLSVTANKSKSLWRVACSSKKAMVICVLVWQHLSTIFVYLKDSPDFVLASNCLTNVNDFLSHKRGISWLLLWILKIWESTHSVGYPKYFLITLMDLHFRTRRHCVIVRILTTGAWYSEF